VYFKIHLFLEEIKNYYLLLLLFFILKSFIFKLSILKSVSLIYFESFCKILLISLFVIKQNLILKKIISGLKIYIYIYILVY
jgi:hypothetical protein